MIVDPQRLAADPRLSAFVTANAGSGKTKTLIDRVARLLLAGADPETILCVTYTKAAAAEMQRRLFDLLGRWSVLDDEVLRAQLGELEARPAAGFAGEHLSKARALFARALETPGGLKIQTIHAFCEKLLRRFPLEAGVSPGFRVMDDADAAAVALSAKATVARHAMAGEGTVAEAYARFAVSLDFASFQSMFADFEARRGALTDFLAREGGLAGARAWAWRAVGLPDGAGAESIAREALEGLDRQLWRRAAKALEAGGPTDRNCAAQMAAVAETPDLAAALAVLFTRGGEGDPAAWVARTAGLRAHEPLRQALLAEQGRLGAARERMRAAEVAEDTGHALTLAQAYLTAHELEKRLSGALDFADLIENTKALLASRPAAAWVLYKLDGGIDHILVDEAQDTAADQWAIIDALVEEFFAGGDTRRARNMFVVGDEKQSIYSFQGAQPELLTRKFEFHRQRATGAGFRFERVDLLASWRSTPQVLAFVDAVFAPPELAAAIQPRVAVEAVRHEAVRREHAGCVDVWPLEREAPSEERQAWNAPLDAELETGANRRLARAIACEVKDLIARGEAVFDNQLGAYRPANAGDVLILVRRRRALFEEILRALKHAGLPVAGADRLALSDHIVFDDLLALARFALFPGDELTLAALLRSPFCELTDESLYALAHGREENLWDCLRRQAGAEREWASAAALLERVLETARLCRPLEFYVQVLDMTDAAGRSMRARILRRLGAEAEEALDEFLAQVLAAERRGLRDLESLAAALASLDITVKREMEAPAGQVRVMTAHGAKGLEAPIVFLPETTLSRAQRGSPLMETDDGGFLWCASGARDCQASAAARARRTAREEAEAYRLLYVAMTRARDRLVLCGRLSESAKEENLKGWWGAIAAAMADEGLAPQVRAVACGGMLIRRYGPDPACLTRSAAPVAGSAAPPAWTARSAPAEAFARYASPSDLGESLKAPAPSPLASAAGGLDRFRRGDLIHRLLQILPDLPPGAWDQAARALLDWERDLSDGHRAEMVAAALEVLRDPRFAEVFGAGSRAEVALVGSAGALPPGLNISGRIDRLVVLPDRVLVADFKTNRPAPRRAEDADPAYLRQLALYAAVLAEVFPGRKVEAAIIWTDGPRLMALPEKLLAQALAELDRAG